MLKNKKSNNKKCVDNAINILNFQARNLIYTFLFKNQGLHFRELVRKLNIPRTTLSYHLRYLEKNGLIVSQKEGRYIRYFISNEVNNKEKAVLNVIRQETTRNILLYIAALAAASQNEISKELEMYPANVEFHLKKLLKNNLIEPAYIKNGIVYTNYNNHAVLKREPVKNEIIYVLKPSIYKYLIKYYNNKCYQDDISTAILYLTENAYPRGTPKKLKPIKKTVERLEKVILEIFPHPYYS